MNDSNTIICYLITPTIIITANSKVNESKYVKTYIGEIFIN